MTTIVEILESIRPECEFRYSRNFFKDGLLDSLTVYILIGQIEEIYQVTLEEKDFVPDNFINIEALDKMLCRYGVQQNKIN